jgi:hypothetical protein
MSSNLAVSNFAVSGTLVVTGKITLSETVTSSSSSSFVDSSTTNLPTCDKVPSSNTQLTNKLFVDNKIATVNSTITSTDNSRKTYIDNADGVLNTRITSTDAEQKIYIDNADAVLNTRITTTDADQKTYIDEAIRLQSLKFVSGDIIQAKALSSRSSSLTNSTINSTVVTEIFSYNFTPKSTNSSIYASFDCYSEVDGTGVDSFETTLVIGNTQVGYKNISFSNDQRNHSIILFPISGHRFNLSLNVLKIYVTGRRMSSDDNLVIYGPSWAMYITEIQN